MAAVNPIFRGIRICLSCCDAGFLLRCGQENARVVIPRTFYEAEKRGKNLAVLEVTWNFAYISQVSLGSTPNHLL